MNNTVNQELCVRCKRCVEVCPSNIVGVDASGLVNFIIERETICLECGQCMAICPTNAISISKYLYKDDFKESVDVKIDNKLFMDFLSARRSIRNFKKTPVEKAAIDKILDSLQYAPYGAEPNKVEITVVNKRSSIEVILPLVEKFLDDVAKWMDNPVVSRLIKYKETKETYCTIKNHLCPIIKLGNYKLKKYGDRITREAPALIIFHADKKAEEHTHNAMIYATYVMLAIHSLKLGGSMNGILPAAINKIDELKTKFEIPQNHEAIISILLGYPKYHYKKMIKREPKRVNYIG